MVYRFVVFPKSHRKKSARTRDGLIPGLATIVEFCPQCPHLHFSPAVLMKNDATSTQANPTSLTVLRLTCHFHCQRHEICFSRLPYEAHDVSSFATIFYSAPSHTAVLAILTSTVANLTFYNASILIVSPQRRFLQSPSFNHCSMCISVAYRPRSWRIQVAGTHTACDIR